jgi:hypothetical protein
VHVSELERLGAAAWVSAHVWLRVTGRGGCGCLYVALRLLALLRVVRLLGLNLIFVSNT